jgi:murein DD-endopeptidase MepM/ murein hydrolase activator NlpD
MRPVPRFVQPVMAAVLAIGMVVTPMAVGFATAQEDPVDDGQVGDLRQQREEARRDAADVAAEIDALDAEDEELVEAVAALDAHIALQEALVEGAEIAIADAEARAEQARVDATALSDEMDEIRERLRRRAVEVFVAPRLDTLEQLNSEDLLEAEIKQTYVDEFIGDEYELIDQLRVARAARDGAERAAGQAAGEAATERTSLVARLDELGTSRQEVETLREAVARRVGEWEALGREYEAADAEMTRQIRELEAEAARQAAAAEEEARRQAEEEARRQAEEEAGDPAVTPEIDVDAPEELDPSPVALGPFVVTSRPVPGAISSPFGPRVHPIFGTVRTHYGLDFRGSMGQTISAAADGTVLKAGWMNGYGWAVLLSHGDGVTTLYAHQSELLVATGDRVSGGDPIGRVGSSGWSTGAHLHWELRIDGVAVDPQPYL